MAVPLSGKVVLDTNVFVDYLRQGLYAEWMLGRVGETIRFLSAIVLMELRLGADTPRRKRAVDRLGPLNDLLIALTARHIGATVVTNNLNEFRRIGKYVPGLAVVAPEQGAGS